ncbi:hypothetical protein JJB07_14925 [Tumebacillus sp. ITR2]|uniref:Uncharacterized protein n=1 Tax=Tumebacillus amylolyticus TaxID=2801339 RepID=A0ABS1JCC8_9BACL|nr:hypothetical protein [Tumebacillus amylolyticus]MBL0387932.1 hypothetical protein [Tumebacillus amylolyticus]
MATNTSNYGLTKPGQNDNYDIEIQNGNMDKIDAQLFANAQAANSAQQTANQATAASSATDTIIGNRTADPSKSPSGLTGSLTNWLSWIVNRIKAITGTTNWFDAPPTTLVAANTHMNDNNNPHGVTAEQVGAIPESQRGAADGVATLDGDGLIPTGQLPAPSDFGALPAGISNRNVRIDAAYELSSDTRSTAVTNGTNGLPTTVTVTDPTSGNATVATSAITYGTNGLPTKITTTAGAHSRAVTINYGTNGLFSGTTPTFS